MRVMVRCDAGRRPPWSAARLHVRSAMSRITGFLLLLLLPLLPLGVVRAEEIDEAERVRRARQHRQELELRKADLPESAKRALRLLERFRGTDLRLWSAPRERILAEGQAAVPTLLVMLEETDWEVRAFAASCLEELAAPAALRPLLEALRGESYTEARRRMVRALAALRSAEAEPTLIAATGDPDAGIALEAVRGLGLLGREEAMPALREQVKSKDVDVRYEVLGSLARLGDEAARQRLMKAAKALVATRDLQRVDSPETLDMGERYEQYLLGVALARADAEEIDDFLNDVLEAKRPWHRKVFLRLGAAEGLGRRTTRGGSLHPGLVDGLTNDDATVRVACSYGLRFVGLPETLRTLKRAQSDPQLDVRTNVMRALGRVGTPDAVKALRKALRDRAPEVRVAATHALGDVPIPESTEALLVALKDRKYVVRVLAARWLARRTADDGVVAALSKAARDPDYGVRAQALASLSRAVTDVEAALPVLVGGIDDREIAVRASACLGVSALLDAAPGKHDLDASFVQAVVGLATETEVERVERAAVELLDAQRPAAAVPALLSAMGSSKQSVRTRANSLLQRVSEKIMPFDPTGSRNERAEAIKRWRTWWEQAGKLPRRDRHAGLAVTGGLAEQTRDLKWRGLDLVLMLDSTGSMAGLLRSAKQSIDEIIAEMSSPLPSLRISLFTYRDFGDNYVYYGTPLTYDAEHLPGFLQSFVHGQGGDIPEAVFHSVSAVMRNLEWREDAHKVIIFAGDAPHHPEQDREFRRDIRAWATKENRAVLHSIFTDTNRRSLDISRRRGQEQPDDFQHPYLDIYRSIAALGRGRAVLLSDESALIKEILVLAFGPVWRADIENFLDFRN